VDAQNHSLCPPLLLTGYLASAAAPTRGGETQRRKEDHSKRDDRELRRDYDQNDPPDAAGPLRAIDGCVRHSGTRLDHGVSLCRKTRAEPRMGPRVRRGLLAIPLYLLAVGVGHSALALYWYDRTTGLPRDGQAFSGTFILGVGLVVLAILTALVVCRFDRSRLALARAAGAGFVVAALMVGYTASRGYLLGGVTGGTPCIAEASGPICAPGDGTYIADARPDVFVILLGIIAAYALVHVAARVQEGR